MMLVFGDNGSVLGVAISRFKHDISKLAAPKIPTEMVLISFNKATCGLWSLKQRVGYMQRAGFGFLF